MEQVLSSSAAQRATGSLRGMLVDRTAGCLLNEPSSLPTIDELGTRLRKKMQRQRRRTRDGSAQEAIECPRGAPLPPAEWAPAVYQLTELARVPVPPPAWWTAAPPLRGGVETRTDPTSYYLDGWNRPGPDDPDVFCFQLGLAGWGHSQLLGEEPQRVTAGQAFFAMSPSRHHCYLPKESPGWTFVWIGMQHPYLASRVAKQVAATGPLIDLRPEDPLVGITLRLVRGALRKDFRDRFEAEIALFEFVVAFERWAQAGRESISEGQRLMDEVRSLVVAKLPKAIGVHSLAAEFGMSRSHFSHFFREQTGLTPAHFATDLRIQKAARMLLDTRAPLKTIADACGFANANHLCKVFRRLRHLSPSAFRQVCR